MEIRKKLHWIKNLWLRARYGAGCCDTCQLAARKELEIIPECDHHFTGKRNGQIMANSYLWAFADEGNFPSHEDGIVLYE